MNSITMPWPAKEVWPNYRQSHHWRSYHKQVKAQRTMAMVLSLEAALAHHWNDAGTHIDLTVDIYPPDKCRRDRDGMKGACKSIFDGIADAIGVDDQYFDPGYRFHEPVKGGKVVVSL